MSYRLAPHHHCLRIGDRVVILDLAHDRYRMLGPSVARAMADLDADILHAPLLERLCEMGILEKGADGNIPTPRAGPARSALELEPLGSESPGFLSVAATLLQSIVGLRTRGLLSTLQALRGRAASATIDPDLLVAIAQGYARQRARLPLRSICLPDSLALHAILVRHGLDASLIFGVRLDPFAAHCWLQSGDLLLNDSCDGVSRFSPIAVL